VRISFSDCVGDIASSNLRSRPYWPQTNGKAKRFIQTALRQWAYAHICRHSQQRVVELPQCPLRLHS
jgi:hypothetical protein